MPYMILNVLSTIGLGFASKTFIDVFNTFDYKHASDNLDVVCRKYSSPKLIPTASLCVLVMAPSICVGIFSSYCKN
jgi:hypothetical protein